MRTQPYGRAEIGDIVGFSHWLQKGGLVSELGDEGGRI